MSKDQTEDDDDHEDDWTIKTWDFLIVLVVVVVLGPLVVGKSRTKGRSTTTSTIKTRDFLLVLVLVVVVLGPLVVRI